MFCALSRVNYTASSKQGVGTYELDEEELQEILSMIQELNLNADLAIKLDQHKRVINLLTGNNDGTAATKSLNKEIIQLMDPCLNELKDLKEQRDKAIEEYFEESAEEKMDQIVEVKRKYKTIFAMLEKSKGKLHFVGNLFKPLASRRK